MLPRFAFGVAHLSDMTHYTHGTPICQALFLIFFNKLFAGEFRGFTPGIHCLSHFFENASNILGCKAISGITELTIHMEGLPLLHDILQFHLAKAD